VRFELPTLNREAGSGCQKRAEMRSVLRSVKKRKKSRVLREVEVVGREEYAELDVDSKVEMIRALVPLGLMHVHLQIPAQHLSLL